MNLFDDIINKRAYQRAVEKFTAELDALGYPYELLDRGLNSGELMELFQTELEKGGREGYTPVLVPDESLLFDFISETKDEGYSVEEALQKPLSCADELIASRLERTEISKDELEADVESPEAFIGEGFSPLDEFSLLFTEYTRSFRLTALIKLPCKNPWEVALYLPFGGSNDCPPPEDMAAILKLWHEKYGAIPAALTSDTLEILLREPLDEKKRCDAAREIIAFNALAHAPLNEKCSGFKNFASSLDGHRVWQFWWD